MCNKLMLIIIHPIPSNVSYNLIIIIIDSCKILFLMHIKAFLKKIADSSLPQRYDPPTVNKQNSSIKKIQSGNLKHGSSLINKSIFKSKKDSELAIKYIQNRNPVIKERLSKGGRLTSISPQKQKSSSVFRKQIEQRLALLMSQRKELVVTRTSRKDSSASIHYHSQKVSPQVKNDRQMPDFVKNIMKPCRIASVRLDHRPKSCRTLAPVSSQPKIYCKKLLPSRQSQPKLRTFSSKSCQRGLKPKQSKRNEPWMVLKGWHEGNAQIESSLEMIV